LRSPSNQATSSWLALAALGEAAFVVLIECKKWRKPVTRETVRLPVAM